MPFKDKNYYFQMVGTTWYRAPGLDKQTTNNKQQTIKQINKQTNSLWPQAASDCCKQTNKQKQSNKQTNKQSNNQNNKSGVLVELNEARLSTASHSQVDGCVTWLFVCVVGFFCLHLSFFWFVFVWLSTCLPVSVSVSVSVCVSV